jgi:hypothetical protein
MCFERVGREECQQLELFVALPFLGNVYSDRVMGDAKSSACDGSEVLSPAPPPTVDSDGEDNSELVRGSADVDETYDPEMDARDAKWVARRKAEVYKITQHKSDAVLSCPACFSIACFDCQQHERNKTQFRAMFVENVTAVTSRTVPVIGAAVGDESVYHPVVCGSCMTQLGAFDPAEEVYHFTNVLPGQS